MYVVSVSGFTFRQNVHQSSAHLVRSSAVFWQYTCPRRMSYPKRPNLVLSAQMRSLGESLSSRAPCVLLRTTFLPQRGKPKSCCFVSARPHGREYLDEIYPRGTPLQSTLLWRKINEANQSPDLYSTHDDPCLNSLGHGGQVIGRQGDGWRCHNRSRQHRTG